MDSATFAFYLGKTPAEYTAVDDLVTLERVLDDLHAAHGGPRARDLGLAFLAQELRDCATARQSNPPDGGALADLAPAMLALLRQLLALYDGQRLSPPEYFASYWAGVRAMIRQAEARAADG